MLQIHPLLPPENLIDKFSFSSLKFLLFPIVTSEFGNYRKTIRIFIRTLFLCGQTRRENGVFLPTEILESILYFINPLMFGGIPRSEYSEDMIRFGGLN